LSPARPGEGIPGNSWPQKPHRFHRRHDPVEQQFGIKPNRKSGADQETGADDLGRLGLVGKVGPDDGVLRRELGLAPDVPIIGSIGRLEPIKGYDIMVEAFAQLRKQWSG